MGLSPLGGEPLGAARGQSRVFGQTSPSMVGVLAEKRDSPRPFRERLPGILRELDRRTAPPCHWCGLVSIRSCLGGGRQRQDDVERHAVTWAVQMLDLPPIAVHDVLDHAEALKRIADLLGIDYSHVSSRQDMQLGGE